MDIPQEDLQGSQPLDLNWPNEGQIEFQHVTLKYKPSLPAALNDVSFRIAAGMQVAFYTHLFTVANGLFTSIFFIEKTETSILLGWNSWKDRSWKIQCPQCTFSPKPYL